MGTLYAKDIALPIETWVNAEDNIEQGCCAIQNQESHLILLGSPETPLGLVTTGDIVASIAKGLPLQDTTLSQIASSSITTIDGNASFLDCLSLFKTNALRTVFTTENTLITGRISKEILLSKHSTFLDEAITEATHNLQVAADSRDALLGTAAHDIRNPLGVILAWCELLDDMLEDQMSLEVAEGMETIRKQGEQILEILNQFLDVTKIDAGKVNLNLTEFDPAEVIITAYKSNLTRAQKKGIPLENMAALKLKPIRADRERIQAAISKLIQNAIKYSKVGEPTLIYAEEDNGTLSIKIKDSGLGIPEKELDLIFTAFAKTSPRPTNGETGTGLGLAIARKIIEMHQGNLTVESAPKEGSTFTIKLPQL